MTLTTSFALLHAAHACAGRYRHLADALGGITAYGRGTPIPLARVLAENGVDDALWALRAVPADQAEQRDRLARVFACDCAEHVLPLFESAYPDDARPRRAIETARRRARGEATHAELAAAGDAARAAARAAAGDAARAAAMAAAGDAARAAAMAAAGDAELAWQADHLREMLEVRP